MKAAGRVICALACGSGLILAGGPAAAAPVDPPITSKPVRVVVLVDESGSLTEADVAEERDAAAIIATGEFSPRSEVAVIGFGSSAPGGGSPLDTVCDLTEVADDAARQYLSTCVGDLRRREAAEGNDTDYVTALSQALSIMERDTDGVDRPGIVFLLTDGKLDVAQSPAWGKTPGQDRTDNAQAELERTILPRAVSAKVQIWPLGFGNVDSAALAALAAGGYQSGCSNRSESIPKARIVNSSTDVTVTLLRAFAGARCAGVTEPSTRDLAAGGTANLPVEIPEIATDGAIQVIKRDPRLKVTFIDPEGAEVPKSGTFKGSTFSGSGASTRLESLRIIDPLPGGWTIRVQAGPDFSGGPVTALVIWQGAVRTTVQADPPRPKAGERVAVRVRLLTRSGQIRDAESLRGLVFQARLTGAGFNPIDDIRLRDDGAAPDPAAADGQFSGYVTVPREATGALEFTGVASGVGIEGDTRPFPTEISTGPPPVIAQIAVADEPVPPGSEATGTVIVTSTLPGPATLGLRLALDDDRPIASITPGTFDIPGSGRVVVPFRVKISPQTPEGHVTGEIALVSTSGPAVTHGNAYFTIEVAYPPPIWEQYWPVTLLLALIAASSAGYLAVMARIRRQAADVRGLTLLLLREGEQLSRLRAAEVPARELVFTIRDSGGEFPRLDRPGSTDRVYTARRHPEGGLLVIGPDGRRFTIRPGGDHPVGAELALGFLDARGRAGERRTAGARAGATPSGPGTGTYSRPRGDDETPWDGLGDMWQGSRGSRDERDG